MPHPGHVMVVEDEPTLRVILTTLLSDAGHQVTPVANAEDALAALSTTAVDAILTDKNLPGLHGLALAQKARALRPGVRIILITGYPSVGAASEALEAGILGFLVKPLRSGPRKICSGAMYSAVPMALPILVTVLTSLSRANPKSISFPSPLCEIMTFSGLMSRCTMPRLWAWARPATMPVK